MSQTTCDNSLTSFESKVQRGNIFCVLQGSDQYNTSSDVNAATSGIWSNDDALLSSDHSKYFFDTVHWLVELRYFPHYR